MEHSEVDMLLFEKFDKSYPFLGSEQVEHFQPGHTHILGICYDGTTSFRPGARFGPDELRKATFGQESYSPYFDRELEEYDILDLGNLPFYPSRLDWVFSAFKQATQDVRLQEHKIKILTFGGEHSISYAPLSMYLEQYPDLVILHLDAHADLRDGYLGEPCSHASVIRRTLDHFHGQWQGMGTWKGTWKGQEHHHQLIQYGIRSGTKEEFDFMKEHQTLVTSLQTVCEMLNSIDKNRPIYLTLDLDFFDPAYLPGTGTPEAGGENFHNFIKILKILSTKNFVGADIVELAPMLDATGNSSCFAAKVAREVLVAMHFESI